MQLSKLSNHSLHIVKSILQEVVSKTRGRGQSGGPIFF